MEFNSEIFQKLPLIKQWILSTLEQHKTESRFVSEFKFQRLPSYYSATTLNSTKVVLIDKIPMPPLKQLGLAQLGDFESGNYAGITYMDTYFLLRNQIYNESIHFHELVHIIQWQHLGFDKFLTVYGTTLLQLGYRNNPLEVMAYKHQNIFEENAIPYNVENNIKTELDKMTSVFK